MPISQEQVARNRESQSSGSTAPQSVQTAQPKTLQAMDPQRPQPDQPGFGYLRGGDRSSVCPGRFCFCIPCPLPCDFCII
ncbi:hypothetical protein F5Y05DRAFT_125056 [Hypoxylon sp. FL0543]|nr:hypothetical protein F5Y05DRAFT_125056 [Hypoxylon sp. FL0543]